MEQPVSDIRYLKLNRMNGEFSEFTTGTVRCERSSFIYRAKKIVDRMELITADFIETIYEVKSLSA